MKKDRIEFSLITLNEQEIYNWLEDKAGKTLCFFVSTHENHIWKIDLAITNYEIAEEFSLAWAKEIKLANDFKLVNNTGNT